MASLPFSTRGLYRGVPTFPPITPPLLHHLRLGLREGRQLHARSVLAAEVMFDAMWRSGLGGGTSRH